MVALAILALFCFGTVVWRVMDGSLKSKSDVDSLASREGVFLLNNFLLLGCMGVVMFGTLGEKISAYFWQETKYTAPWFNSWMVPGGLALLIMMGVGPLIPWRKVTYKAFQKNFVVPLVVSTVGTVLIYAFDVYHLQAHLAATHVPFGEVPLGRVPLAAELTGVYSLIGFWGVIFVTYTLSWEFLRGARARASSTKEGLWDSMIGLMIKQKRRYGGYLAHLGFAGLFLGFIGTGLKTEKDLKFDQPGVTHQLEDKQLTFLGITRDENREYSEWFAEFEVNQLNADGTVGESLGVLRPSRRSYHGANVRLSRNTTEKDELFLWKANVYLALISFRPQFKTAEVMAHYNPMIIFMWIGGAILLLGVAVSLWPEPTRYAVFAATRRQRRRAEAEAEAAPIPDGELARVGADPGEP